MYAKTLRKRFQWHRAGPGRVWRALLLAVAALLILTGGALAQGQEPTIEEINEIARELWCPLCNGVRLDVCDLRACDQMRDTISQQLSEGKDKAAIKEYFINLYGPVVLGEPPRSGFNLLAWLLPFVALAGGAGYVFYTARRWTQRRQAAAIATGQEATTKRPPHPNNDPYLQKVDEELQKLK